MCSPGKRQWNFASLLSKVSFALAENPEPSKDGRTGIDDGEVDPAVDLSEHTNEAFDREALRAAVAEIGHAPFIDTEQCCGDDGREVVDESQYLVGELLTQRGNWRFDGIPRHAPNLR